MSNAGDAVSRLLSSVRLRKDFSYGTLMASSSGITDIRLQTPRVGSCPPGPTLVRTGTTANIEIEIEKEEGV
jgi:hypothetical protein